MLRGFASSQAQKKASALLSAQFHPAQFPFSPSHSALVGLFLSASGSSLGSIVPLALTSGVPARILPVPPRQSSSSSLPVPPSIEIKRENPESDTNVAPFINLNKLNPKKSGMEGKKRKSVLRQTRSKSAVK